MPDLDDERKIMDVKRARIHHVVQRVGLSSSMCTTLVMTGSMTCCWRPFCNRIRISRIHAASPRERNCPPEDVGGSGGYENYLVALADPEDEEHEDLLAWRGPFDRKHFRSPPSTSNSRRSSTPFA